MFLRALAALTALFLVSCGSAKLSAPEIAPYRIEIQQGNYVSQEMVAQLKLGMSKDQVRFVLGTPLITDSFHADRWDYVFRRQRPGSKELERHKLAVFFEDGKLARIDTDVIPAGNADVGGVRMPEQPPVAPAAKPAPPQAKPEPPATRPDAPKPAAAAADKAKPAPAAAQENAAAAAADNSTAVAASPADKPQEKKGFWDKVKDAVKF